MADASCCDVVSRPLGLNPITRLVIPDERYLEERGRNHARPAPQKGSNPVAAHPPDEARILYCRIEERLIHSSSSVVMAPSPLTVSPPMAAPVAGPIWLLLKSRSSYSEQHAARILDGSDWMASPMAYRRPSRRLRAV